jgi:putative restriction endonuclease
MALSKQAQLFILRQVLAGYSDDLELAADGGFVRIQLNGTNYFFILREVTDSGNNRPNEDENRIQFGISVWREGKLRHNRGETVLVLGYSPKTDTFTTWSPSHEFGKARKGKRQVSVYSRFSSQNKAIRDGIASYRPEKNVATLTISSTLLGAYIENYKIFHSLSDKSLLAFGSKLSKFISRGTTGSLAVPKAGKKLKVTITRTAFARSDSFRRGVLATYRQTCCVCGLQLKLVEAAHILPHSHPDSTDQITNGLALCALHHAAFDYDLLQISPTLIVGCNKEIGDFLRAAGLSAELDTAITQHVGKKLRSPILAADKPSKDFIQKRNDLLRGKL